VKNLFELNQRTVSWSRGTCSRNNRGDAQTGFAINIKRRTRTAAPVLVAGRPTSRSPNVIVHSGNGLAVIGSRPAHRAFTPPVRSRTTSSYDIDGSRGGIGHLYR